MEKKSEGKIHPGSGVYFLIFTVGRTHVGPVSRRNYNPEIGYTSSRERESGGVDFNRVGFVKSS